MPWSLLGALTRLEFVASDSSTYIDGLKYCFVFFDRATLPFMPSLFKKVDFDN